MIKTIASAISELNGTGGGDSGGGASGGVMVVTSNVDTGELSASYDELKSALLSGKHIDLMSTFSVSEETISVWPLTNIKYEDNSYSAGFGTGPHFVANSSTEPMGMGSD